LQLAMHDEFTLRSGRSTDISKSSCLVVDFQTVNKTGGHESDETKHTAENTAHSGDISK